MNRSILVTLIVPGLVAPQSLAADWTQFRGPNGSGIATDANVPTTWSETKNLLLKTALPGRG